MPALAESMYCSEQICIPPTFPYLLRQYAKAAIRSQPSDLLRWSTAYFRCLSLNIPPPVKPRLEYPIPRSHFGITPGWLKALLTQLPSTQTVDFKVLWDRWIGACLEHHTLIQILCLGGFNDPAHIPWLRFLGLCAAHLTEDLTHSMILICEIFTEEPEGGSDMIPVDVFVDVYKFLASIDASHDQILKNYYFLDDLLALWKTKVEKFQKEIELEAAAEESSTTTEAAEEMESEEEKKKSVDEVISCPSIDQDVADDYMQFMEDGAEVTDEPSDDMFPEILDEPDDEKIEEKEPSEKEVEVAEDEEPKEAGEEEEETEEKEAKEEEDEDEVEDEQVKEPEKEAEEGAEDHDSEDRSGGSEEQIETIMEVKGYESLDTLEGKPDFEQEKQLKEDLERLKALQTEMAGETDDELEKYKCQLMQELPMTSDQELAIQHFEPPESTSETKTALSDKDRGSEMQPEDQEEPYEDVFVPAVPGIGGIVPLALVNAVEDYMRLTACEHEGMVMPRDVRHYSCPPLQCPIEVN